MGGKEALRGFLYQGFASVLEALCHEGWDRIYIELDSKNDKVDIALEANHVIVKSIQVKSTINIFKKIESFPPNEIKSEENRFYGPIRIRNVPTNYFGVHIAALLLLPAES